MASLTDDTTKEKTDKGFAKFLAVRRGQPPVHVDLDEGIKAGIDEGKEVERDGYGDWTLVRVDEDGNGIGVSADAVDVSWMEKCVLIWIGVSLRRANFDCAIVNPARGKDVGE